MEKNLTSGHLGAKMGIATALFRSWEDGSIQPNRQQFETLAALLGFKTGMVLPNLLYFSKLRSRRSELTDCFLVER